jgi:hypothetical protein
MRSRCIVSGSLAVFLLALSAQAADDTPKKGNKVVPTIDSDTFPAGDYAGKLISTPGTDGSFVVEIQVPKLVLKNPNQLPKGNKYANITKEQAKITQLQNQLASTKNSKQYAQKYAQLQNAIAALQRSIAAAGLDNPYKVVYDPKDVTFHAAEEYKVRRLELPVVFDDKGEPKKYTEEEKKELKGKDKNLPGYEAKPDDLAVGQMVRVTIAKFKKKPDTKNTTDKTDKDKADKDAKTDKDAKDPKTEPSKDDDPKMVANLVLILAEPVEKDKPKRDKKDTNNN